MGRLPLIMSYVLTLLKACSILRLKTHTHTSIHLSIQHGISSRTYHSSIMLINQPQHSSIMLINQPQDTSIMANHIKPNIHLSYMVYYQGSKQIMAKRQAWQQSINHHIYSKLLDMKSSIKQTYKNASPYQCITYLTYFAASQHL